MRVLRKTQNPGQECPARGYFRSRASGSATPLRPSAHGPSATMPVRDSCSRKAGAKLSGNIKARPEPLRLPHDDRAVIEIQILDPQLQTLTDPHARFHTEAGRTNDARLQKTEDANHFIRVQHHRQAPRRPRSSDLLKRADPCTAPCRRRTTRPPMLTMRGDQALRSFASQDRNASTSLPKVAG